MAHTYNPSTHELETGDLGIKVIIGYTEFKSSLCHMRLSSKAVQQALSDGPIEQMFRNKRWRMRDWGSGKNEEEGEGREGGGKSLKVLKQIWQCANQMRSTWHIQTQVRPFHRNQGYLPLGFSKPRSSTKFKLDNLTIELQQKVKNKTINQQHPKPKTSECFK